MTLTKDFQKTLENSPEWQDMEKSLKEALAKFDKNETKEVVDVPLIKGFNAVKLHLFLYCIFLTVRDHKCIVLSKIKNLPDWEDFRGLFVL